MKLIRWTDESVLAEARKYSHRSEWYKASRGSYAFAKRNGIFSQASAHMTKKLKWSRSALLEDAKKYQTKKLWSNCSPIAYKAALKNADLFSICTSHMVRVGGASLMELKLLSHIQRVYPRAHSAFFNNKDKDLVGKKFQLDIYIPELRKGIEINGNYWHSAVGLKRSRPNWTEEQISSYHSIKGEFFRRSGIAILTLWENDIKTSDDQCLKRVSDFIGADLTKYPTPDNLEFISKKWASSSIIQEARRYTTKSEWARLSQYSYRVARKVPELFRLATYHMKKRIFTAKWTKESILTEAKKYKTSKEWKARNYASYRAAQRRYLLKHATLHMNKYSKKWGV